MTHSFLERYCNERGGVTKDLVDSAITVHLRVLGLLGKVITGPWRSLFYSELRGNLDTTTELQSCITFLERLQAQPATLATTQEDCFGKQLDNDNSVLLALQTRGATDQAYMETVKLLSTKF